MSGRLVGNVSGSPSATLLWSQIDGPEPASFDDVSSSSPVVTFRSAGTYTFRLTATDGGSSVSDDVVVTVTAPPSLVVDAGVDQSLELIENLPGLWFGTVGGNINTTDSNPKSELLVDPNTKIGDSIPNYTTEIFTGNIYDADGQISFREYIDNKARIWVDGVLVLSDNNWSTEVFTGNLNLSPGWHTFEVRISNAAGGSGPVSGPGIGFDPAGGSDWQPLTDPGDGSLLRVDYSMVSSRLIGSVNGSPSATLLWSQVSGPSSVSFDDVSSASPLVLFGSAGTYTFRLTATDGADEAFDEVTITVVLPVSAASDSAVITGLSSTHTSSIDIKDEISLDEDYISLAELMETSHGDPLTDLAHAADFLINSEFFNGSFTLKVLTIEGDFLLHFTPGEEYEQVASGISETFITYTADDDISAIVSEMFVDYVILDIKVAP